MTKKRNSASCWKRPKRYGVRTQAISRRVPKVNLYDKYKMAGTSSRPFSFACPTRRYFLVAVQLLPFIVLASTVPLYLVVPAVKLMLPPSSFAPVIGVAPSVPLRF
jgi:hypothetical protein